MKTTDDDRLSAKKLFNRDFSKLKYKHIKHGLSKDKEYKAERLKEALKKKAIEEDPRTKERAKEIPLKQRKLERKYEKLGGFTRDIASTVKLDPIDIEGYTGSKGDIKSAADPYAVQEPSYTNDNNLSWGKIKSAAQLKKKLKESKKAK